ncbi:hypothetical protein Tco_0420574 [Tanacetum coccineum]
MVNGVRQLQALVDKKKLIITESSIRSDLHLDDAEGTDCLPTATIFEELARMGYEKPSQKLIFIKLYFLHSGSISFTLLHNALVPNSLHGMNSVLDGGVKFLMYPRFLQVFINKQHGDMSHHNKIFVNPFYTKKVFANMKRAGKDFSGRITPLFDTMMVQASEEVGEDSDHPTYSNQIPIIDQPSTPSHPKQKSKRRQRNETEVSQDETEHEESVPTPSNDPLPSSEDSMQLNELMVLCTKLQTQVLDLKKARDAQAKEIADLKKRIQRLERKKKSRPSGLKRLKKVGMSRRVESSEDQESLGDYEGASKQERSIKDIDDDVDVTLVDETQERQDEDLMFDTGVLDDEKDEQSTKLDDNTAGEAVTTAGEAVTTAGVEGSAAPIILTTVEETLAQTLMEIKAAKPKAKGIVFHDQEEQVFVSKPTVFVTQTLVKDKGKEEERLERQKQEEANIALIESWENTQAMMEADRLLDKRLQTREREELTDEEKGKLFMELMEKRRKHFAALRAQEKRNRPPIKAQKRTQMSTYLKHMGGYKHKQLMGKSYNEIQKLFDKEMKRVNTFVAMSSETQESNEKKEEGSKEKAKWSRKKMLVRKRAGKEQQQESSKKQIMEEVQEVEEVEEDDEAELKKHLVIKKDDDIAIDDIPLATKPLVIVDYKLLKEGIMLIKRKHGDIRPEDDHERVLWGDFKVMFEPDIRSKVWRDLQGYTVSVWKLYDSCGVHFASAAGEKITTADYNCLKTFYCQEDKDELKR